MGTADTSSEKTHCELIGEWVAARCARWVGDPPVRPVPPEVIAWLGTIRWNPAPEATNPTCGVLGWVVKTLNNPDWAE